MPYDELALFHENAEEFGLPWRGAPDVRRVAVDVGADQSVSALVWGSSCARARACSTAARRTRTPGTPWRSPSTVRSSRSTCPATATRRTGPITRTGRRENAVALEIAVRELAPDARLVVGMSLGGLSAIALTDRAPDLVRALMLVDVTPGVNREKARAIAQFIDGPEYFESFDRSSSAPSRSTRRGPSNRCAAASCTTRSRTLTVGGAGATTCPAAAAATATTGAIIPGIETLWDAISNYPGPITLARGALSPVVDDADVAELLRRRPDAQVEVFDGAGHSIQGDKPIELAAYLASALDG